MPDYSNRQLTKQASFSVSPTAAEQISPRPPLHTEKDWVTNCIGETNTDFGVVPEGFGP